MCSILFPLQVFVIVAMVQTNGLNGMANKLNVKTLVRTHDNSFMVYATFTRYNSERCPNMDIAGTERKLCISARSS